MAFFEADLIGPKTKMIKYTYRRYTEDGATAFKEWIKVRDWTDVVSLTTTDDKAEQLGKILEEATEKFFPLTTTTRRESDPKSQGHATV